MSNHREFARSLSEIDLLLSSDQAEHDPIPFLANRASPIQPGKCITLYFHTCNGDHGNDNNNHPYPIELHRTLAQDLLLDLGPPARKYTKQDGRFEGMYGTDSASGSGRDHGRTRKDKNGMDKGKGGEGGKVWWNYFHLGLDFLVDEDEGGVVVKVMVHSNIVSRRLESIRFQIADIRQYHSRSNLLVRLEIE
jgi:hypothetical protein